MRADPRMGACRPRYRPRSWTQSANTVTTTAPLQYEDPSGYDSLTDDAEYGPTPDDGHPTAANGTPTKTVTGQSDPNNGHYQALNDAARAAAGHTTTSLKDSEVGRAVYCTGGAGTCGYGPAAIGPPSHGSYGNVGVDLSPYQGDRQVGIWHTHPAGAGADTTGEHANNASRTFHTPGLRWLDSLTLHDLYLSFHWPRLPKIHNATGRHVEFGGCRC